MILDKKYSIIKKFKQGGMSDVFLVKHKVLGHLRILKVINKEDIPDIMLMTEPNLLKSIVHPSIPQIYDVEETSDKLYILKEYIEGETLSDIIKKDGPFDEERARKLFIELCNAISFLHNKKPPIIHRDLKPTNIIISPDDHLYIVDFGISRTYKSDSTRDTCVYGNIMYSAPESFGTAQSDIRSDIYSLGLIYYYMLTGREMNTPPYEVVPPRLLNKKISKASDSVIMNSTNRNPLKRYKKVSDILSKIEGKISSGKQAKIRKIALASIILLITVFTSIFVIEKHKAITTGGISPDNLIITDISATEMIYTANHSEEEMRLITPSPTEEPTATPDIIYEFQDKALEKMVRLQMGKEDFEPIYMSEIKSMTELQIIGEIIWNDDEIISCCGNGVLEGARFADGSEYHGTGEIKSLEDLRNFTNLQILRINNNLIEDLSPLTELPHLYFLNLGANRITDPSDVFELKNLRYLHLFYNRIESIEGISNLIYLDTFFADVNNITDISPLEGMYNLRNISLSRNHIEDISILSTLPNIVELWVDYNSVSDFNVLYELKYLSRLYYGQNPGSFFSENQAIIKDLESKGVEINLY